MAVVASCIAAVVAAGAAIAAALAGGEPGGNAEVVMVRQTDQACSIYGMLATGGATVRIASFGATLAGGTWISCLDGLVRGHNVVFPVGPGVSSTEPFLPPLFDLTGAYILDLTTGEGRLLQLPAAAGVSDNVNQVDLSPDGTRMVSLTLTGVAISDLSNGAVRALGLPLPSSCTPSSVTWAGDGIHLAVGCPGFYRDEIIDPETGSTRSVPGVDAWSSWAAVHRSPNGSHVAYTNLPTPGAVPLFSQIVGEARSGREATTAYSAPAGEVILDDAVGDDGSLLITIGCDACLAVQPTEVVSPFPGQVVEADGAVSPVTWPGFVTAQPVDANISSSIAFGLPEGGSSRR